MVGSVLRHGTCGTETYWLVVSRHAKVWNLGMIETQETCQDKGIYFLLVFIFLFPFLGATPALLWHVGCATPALLSLCCRAHCTFHTALPSCNTASLLCALEYIRTSRVALSSSVSISSTLLCRIDLKQPLCSFPLSIRDSCGDLEAIYI